MRTLQARALASGSLALAALALLGVAWPSPAAAALPQVAIDGRERIRNEPKVPVRLEITAAGDAGYAGRAGVELRGQSSLTFPKKSYGIELRDRSGEGRDAALLGMPADDDWVLYASYNDKTLLRNVVAFETSRWLGRWAARTRFVELKLNGRYEGVYVLMQRPELGAGRVESEDEGITGAYLMELTLPFQARVKGPFFRTPIKRRTFVYEDPEASDLSRAEGAYIRKVIRRAELSLYRGSPGPWRRYIDARAAVDYVLLQELFRNLDAFRASTYMTKGSGRALALGPIWDLDLAMGNTTFGDNRFVAGWETRTRAWAERLHRDAGFRRALRGRWRELRRRGLRTAVLAAVDRGARDVRPGVRANFRRWPILGVRVWQNPAARGSHGAEVRFLRTWLSRRIAWLDRALSY